MGFGPVLVKLVSDIDSNGRKTILILEYPVHMNLRTFRFIALIEGTTFLVLLVASIVKRVADQPVGVEILGPIHGVAFLAYVGMVFMFRGELRWSWKTTGLALNSR